MKNWLTHGTSSINKGMLSYDGISVFSSPNNSLDSFLSGAYEALGIQYPKYFKMDNACKLAFLATEVLLKNNFWINNLPKEQIAICTQTASSSLLTDLKFQQTIQHPEAYFPSPSVFVYTLSNIAAGEICIRNKFKGENLCLVQEQFDLESVLFQISDWFEHEETKVGLVGWIEVSENDYSTEWKAISRETIGSLTQVPKEKT